MNKLIIIFLLISFLSISVFSQTKELKNQIDVSISEGNYLKACNLLQNYLKTDSTDVEAYYKLGKVYQSLFQNSKAQAAFEKAIKLSPENIRLKYNLGRFFYETGKNKEAWMTFRNLYQADSSDKNIAIFYSHICYQIGNFTDALSVYKQLFTSDTTDIILLNKIAYCNLALGNTRKSINFYKSSIEINDKYTSAHKMLAYIYSKIDKYDSAMLYIDRAIKIDTSDIDAYKRRADINFKNNYHFRHIKDHLKVYYSGDSTADITYKLGIGYYNIKRFAEAKPFLEKSYLFDLTNDDVTYSLAVTYSQLHMYTESIKFFEITMKLLQRNVWAYMNTKELLADEMVKVGKYKEAVNYYEYHNYFYSFLVYLKIAKLYDEQLNNKSKAIYYYQLYINEAKEYKYDNKMIEIAQKRMDWLKNS